MNYQEELNIAKNYIKVGRYDKVIEIIKILKDKDGQNPQLLYDVGLLFGAMGYFQYALDEINRSFEIEKSVEKLEMLANLNMELFNYSEAAIQYEELTKHIKSRKIYKKCVEAYKRLEYDEEAIRVLKMMTEEFDDATSYSALTLQYIIVGMEKEALDCMKEAESKFKNHPAIYNLQGFIHECIYNDYEKAKFYFKKAASLGYIEAYYNLGVCCKQSEDLVNAEKYLKKLISLGTNDSINYNYTLGSVYLAKKKLRLGYKYYTKRNSAKKLKEINRFKLWDGKDYPEETLYISTEQGFGDNLQFIRYLPFLTKKFKKIYYGVRGPLLELFKRNFPEDKYPNIEIINIKNHVYYDKYALIMEVPFLLHKTFHDIPNREPYLCADNRKVEMYKKNFFNNDDLKIGLCWRSKGMELRDAVYRTIDAPYYFKDIMELDNTKYYSFQMNDIFGMCKKYPQIKDLAPMLTSFDETAAALKNLDILITVDTSIAHLAGALGVKTYLLLCHAPDWRWFDNTEKTEWYDSITIIKQQDRKTWEDVSAKLTKFIKNDLKKLKKKTNKND